MIQPLITLVIGLLGGYFGHDAAQDVVDVQPCDSYFRELSAEMDSAGAKFAGVQAIPGGQILIWADPRSATLIGYLFAYDENTAVGAETQGFTRVDKCISPTGMSLQILVMSKKLGQEAESGESGGAGSTADGSAEQ